MNAYDQVSLEDNFMEDEKSGRPSISVVMEMGDTQHAESLWSLE